MPGAGRPLNFRLPRMAHSHRHPRPRRRKLPGWGLGAASACAAAAVVAIAVGISQATASPACAAVAGPAAPASTAQTSGEATHYMLTPGDGNCSYPGLPNGGLFVALSPSEYAGSAACGSYLEVTGPDGSVIAEVVDQCPPCQAGHVRPERAGVPADRPAQRRGGHGDLPHDC